MNETDRMHSRPVEDRRHFVSPDTYSRQRLKALRELYSYIHREWPFRFALTFGGSLSQGRELTAANAKESDIDYSIFVDIDSIQNHYDEFSQTNTDFKDFLLSPKIKPVKDFFGNPIKEPKVEDQRLEFIRSFVEYKAGLWVINLTTNFEYPPSISHPNVFLIAKEGKNSILDIVEDLQIASVVGFPPLAASAGFLLTTIFNLEIGGHMRVYREAFISQLQKLPQEDAEMKWQLLRNSVEYYERRNKIPQNLRRQYPENFKDAMRQYGGRMFR